MKDKVLPRINQATDRVMIQVARTLSSLMEQWDVSLKDHSVRVADNCANFCESMCHAVEEEVEAIYIAGLLHDIGLVFVPSDIIQKPADLTEEQSALVRNHPIMGETILCNLIGLNELLPIIRHHHEAFDGGGYPDGLAGTQIPFGARLLCLFDSYDTMAHPRTQQSGSSMQDILAGIKTKSGTQFDADLLNDFVKFIESNGGQSEGWLEKKDKASIRQIFKEIIINFKAGKFDAPVMPQIVHEVQSVIKQSTSSVDDVARVVEKDPVLSLRLIAVANSPVYRGVQKIDSLKHAIPRIGLKETHNIIIAISIRSLFETNRIQFRHLMNDLWRHSLACAYCAKMIAQELKLNDSEKYFLLGLIHDIGKTLLLRAVSDVSQSETLNVDLVKANIQEAHRSLGAGLLKRWGFGDEFIQVVSHHEDTEFESNTEKAVLITHVANTLTRKLGCSLIDDEIDIAELDSVKLLEIDPNALERISEEAGAIMHDLQNLI